MSILKWPVMWQQTDQGTCKKVYWSHSFNTFILYVASPYRTIILIGTILLPYSSKGEVGSCIQRGQFYLLKNYFIVYTTHNICSKTRGGVVPLTKSVLTSGFNG